MSISKDSFRWFSVSCKFYLIQCTQLQILITKYSVRWCLFSGGAYFLSLENLVVLIFEWAYFRDFTVLNMELVGICTTRDERYWKNNTKCELGSRQAKQKVNESQEFLCRPQPIRRFLRSISRKLLTIKVSISVRYFFRS